MEIEMMTFFCKNCDLQFRQCFNYCPNCGQEKILHRLNFHDISHKLVHAFFHADKGIFLLFKELCYKPGSVARLYVEGKRKKYYDPFSFLVFMVAIAIFFVLKFESLSVTHFHIDSYNRELIHFLFKYFNIFIFLMCPVNAFFIWLIFKKNKMNYTETLVLSAYVSGQTMLFYCIILIPFFIFNSIGATLGIITGILLAIWSAIAVLQFYRTKSFFNILKAICLIIILQSVSQGLFYLVFLVDKRCM